MGEKALSLRKQVEAVVVVPNVRQLNSNSNSSSREVVTKEEVEDGVPNLNKEVVEGMVGGVAVVVVDPSVVEWQVSSIMVGPLSITNKAGEVRHEEGYHSSGVVAAAVVVWVVALGLYLLLVGLLDHQFPSCTKQPRLLIRPG